MTAAVRKTPDATNITPPIDATTYAADVNNEIKALWQVASTRLTSVSGTNDILCSSDTALVAAIAAYAQPMSFWLIPANTNTGGVTINIDSVGVVNLKDNAAATLAGGALVAGSLYLIEYDGTGFRVVGAGSAAASSSNSAPDMILRDEKTTGTSGGSFTSGSFAKRTLNTAVRNVLSGGSLSNSQFTLQAGTYYIEWSAPANFCGTHQTRLYNATDASVVETGTSEMSAATTASWVTSSRGSAVVTITSAKAFEIDHICNVTRATDGFGVANNAAAKEVYAWVNIWKVGSLPSQVNGVAGGAVTWPVVFDTATADADPGAGKLRLDNATENAAATIFIDLSDANLTDVTALIDYINSVGSAASHGSVRLVKYDDPTKWLVFNITAWTTASGYRKLTVALLGSSAASPFAIGDRLYFAYTAPGATGATGSIAPSVQGRLTLATGTPVMTTTQSGKTTLYFSPYIGNQIPIYDGSNLIPTVFSELSVATTDTAKNPAAIGASKVNDWFVWNDAGTVRLSHGPDWTNDTTRSAGTALVRVSGILLNNASITNGPAASRGTYVGTTRSNGSSQLDWIYGAAASGGTAAFLGVWNMYNRVTIGTNVIDNGAQYTYTSATMRQARASAGNQIGFIAGLAEDAVWFNYATENQTVTNAGSFYLLNVALDNTTGLVANQVGYNAVTGSQFLTLNVVGQVLPALGFHTLLPIERSDGTNAQVFDQNSTATLSALLRM